MNALFSNPHTGDDPLRLELERRGIAWPLGCYAPGHYVGNCTACSETYVGDKRSTTCIRCAAERVIDDHAEFVRMHADLQAIFLKREAEVGVTDPSDWRYPVWCVDARERLRLLQQGIDILAPQVAILEGAGA